MVVTGNAQAAVGGKVIAEAEEWEVVEGQRVLPAGGAQARVLHQDGPAHDVSVEGRGELLHAGCRWLVDMSSLTVILSTPALGKRSAEPHGR